MSIPTAPQRNRNRLARLNRLRRSPLGKLLMALVVIGVVGQLLWRLSLSQQVRQGLAGLDLTAPRMLLPLSGGLLVLLLLLALWKVPQAQVVRVRNLDPKDYLAAENAARATLAQIIGGTVVIIGLFFSWGTLDVAREGQITERFTRAIDQLGSERDDKEPKIEVRLGGIYALERIARESDQDYGPIMEVLTTYVRENAPRKADQLPLLCTTAERPRADIQAVLTVLGRRKIPKNIEETVLNLSGTNIRHANLFDKDLRDVNLSAADLRCADFEKANLVEANLSAADLRDANLRGADLSGANLNGANLNGADLNGADLNAADLRSAEYLEWQQVYVARLDRNPQLPSSIVIPSYISSALQALPPGETLVPSEVPDPSLAP